MKRNFICTFLLCLFYCFFSCGLTGFSQQLESKTIAIDTNCNGYYTYLPKNYSVEKKFPLLIVLHGMGELGNGNSDLPKVLRNGPMKLIADGSFPDSFVVNGTIFSFIVFAPQFVRWPWPGTTTAIIDFAIRNYSVDTTRIYLTGLSMGGGAVWECIGNNPAYAKKIAAAVPVCGASLTDSIKGRNIASADLPIWATHNDGDKTVTVEYTWKYIRSINDAPIPPKPRARLTIFPVQSHNAWTKTFDPNYRENGFNVYEWMLLQHR